MKLILLNGVNGSGKSYIADCLVHNYNYVKFSFAHYVRQRIKEKYNITINNKNRITNIEAPPLSVMHRYGGNEDDIRQNRLTQRGLMIYTAEKIKDSNPFYFVYLLINDILESGHKKIVVDDLRFLVEYQAILNKFENKAKFYRVIKNTKRVLRPNEVELDNIQFDGVIDNNDYRLLPSQLDSITD